MLPLFLREPPGFAGKTIKEIVGYPGKCLITDLNEMGLKRVEIQSPLYPILEKVFPGIACNSSETSFSKHHDRLSRRSFSDERPLTSEMQNPDLFLLDVVRRSRFRLSRLFLSAKKYGASHAIFSRLLRINILLELYVVYILR